MERMATPAQPVPPPAPIILAERLETAFARDSREERTAELTALTPDLLGTPAADLYALWCTCLHAASTRTRSDVLADLQTLAPVLIARSSPDAIRAITVAIAD